MDTVTIRIVMLRTAGITVCNQDMDENGDDFRNHNPHEHESMHTHTHLYLHVYAYIGPAIKSHIFTIQLRGWWR